MRNLRFLIAVTTIGLIATKIEVECRSENEQKIATRVTCPPGPGPNFIPDETDCSKYYICYDGEATSQNCPTGTYWSQEALDCLNPSVANCPYPPPTTTISTTLIPTTTQIPITTTTIEISTAPPGICPPGMGPIFVPDPEDCTKYYVCYNEEATSQSCGPGLHWSATEEDCLKPEIAGCNM